jgi:hypothetical protein
LFIEKSQRLTLRYESYHFGNIQQGRARCRTGSPSLGQVCQLKNNCFRRQKRLQTPEHTAGAVFLIGISPGGMAPAKTASSRNKKQSRMSDLTANKKVDKSTVRWS